MKNSDFQRLSALILGMAASSAIAADVSLKGEAKLTGEVATIAEDGSVTLVSPFSEKPLQLSSEQLESIVFGLPSKSPELPEQRLELINGDILPVKITSMEEGLLKVESPVFGSLAIPREAVSSLQFGIVPQKFVYSGPGDFDGWTREKSGGDSWNNDNGAMVATGYGSLSRNVGLPEKFILRFRLGWNNQPNFQFAFAQSAKKGGDETGRYIAELNGTGFGLFREETSGSIKHIMKLARSEQKFAKRSMEVDIRMDRSRGLIELHIDGELVGRYTDPVLPVPPGTGISLISRASGASGQSVRDIKILAWDDRGDRHRTEERGDGKSDSLIGRFGERFGGKLERIRPNGGSTVYLFKSDFQKELLQMPEEEISTMFLGGEGKPSQSETTGGLILNLHGKGTMRVSSCALEGNTMKINHPLLGSLEFSREGVASIERIWIPKAKPVKNR